MRSYRPDKWEALAVAGVIASAFYFLWLYEFHWHAFVLVSAMIVSGYMMGDMLYDLWMPRRRK